MFKHFIKLLMMAIVCSMVEDDGIPSSGEEFGEDIPASNTNVPQETQNETITLSREELAQLVAPIQEYSQEKAINAAVSDIKGRIGEFDLNKVHDHLKELNKSNPEQAAALNNPQGWELVWLRELAAKSVSADAVNSGRNVDSDGGRQAMIDKIARGEGGVLDRASLMEKWV